MPKERQKYLQDLKMLNWRPIFYFLKHPLIERQKYPLLLSTETEWLILISPAVAISANSLITSPWSQCCEAIVLTLFVRWRIEIQRFLILKWQWVIFAIKRRTCFHPLLQKAHPSFFSHAWGIMVIVTESEFQMVVVKIFLEF